MNNFKRVTLLFFLIFNSSLFAVDLRDIGVDSSADLNDRAMQYSEAYPKLLCAGETRREGPSLPEARVVDLRALKASGYEDLQTSVFKFILSEQLNEEAARQDWHRKIEADSFLRRIIDQPRYWMFEASYWLESSERRGLKEFVEGREKIKKDNQNKSFLQPKYIVPAVVGLSTVGYYAYKKYKNRNNKDYMQLGAFENVEKAAAWSCAFTILIKSLKEAGFKPIAAIMPFLMEAVISEPNLLQEDILKTGFSLIDMEPRFQNAWLFLLRSVFAESAGILNYSPHLIENVIFLVDLIYPIYQFWRLTGHLLPELKIYLRDNLLRHSVKYTVKQFLKFNKVNGGLGLIGLTSQVLLKYKIVPMKIIQKSTTAQVYFLVGQGSIDNALDLLLDAFLGEKSQYANGIMKFAKDNLRKVDLTVEDQNFKVDIKPEALKDLKSIFGLLQRTGKTLKSYEGFSQNIELFRQIKKAMAEESNKSKANQEVDSAEELEEVLPAAA